MDSLRSELVELTQRLVRTPSVNPPGDERGVSRVVGEEMEALGFDLRYVEPKPKRVNTLGALEGVEDEGGGLLFNGHYDTVPIGNMDNWSVDPFEAVVKDGLIYGRGSGDMKGAIASALIAARALVELGIPLNRDFMIHCVADEEYFGRFGTKYLAENGYISPSKVEMAVVGEGSTRDWRIYARTAVRGRRILEIVTKGVSAHSSRPESGVNAVLKMSKILLALNDHMFSFPKHHLLPDPTIAPGTLINGGTKDNVIPEHCKAVCDLRTVPGMEINEILEEIRGLIGELRNEDPELDAEVTNPLGKPPSEISLDEKVYKIANRALLEVKGYRLEPIGTSGSNDTSWITTIAGVPAMAFGPGGGGAHGADEWVSIDMLLDFAKIYGLMAIYACGVGD
ncbi:MAG: M20 family metallopeptidase [Candidatus Bathyarchaeia archaeon]